MKLKRKMLSGFLDLFPNLDFRSNDNKEGIKETKKAETDDTLDMDKSKRIHLAGSISSKGLRILYGTERVEILPDMNKEPLLAVDGKNSKDGEEGETSNTATQSMDVEHNNKKLFKECKSLWSDPEINSRSQVKRLKTNASDYTRSETKSMMAVGASSKESDFVSTES